MNKQDKEWLEGTGRLDERQEIVWADVVIVGVMMGVCLAIYFVCQ